MLQLHSTSGGLILPKRVQHCLKLEDTQDLKQKALSFKKQDVHRTFQLDFFSTEKAYTQNFWISFLIFLLEVSFSFGSSVANFGLFCIGQEQIGHITGIAQNPSSYFNLLYRMSQLVYFQIFYSPSSTFLYPSILGASEQSISRS